MGTRAQWRLRAGMMTGLGTAGSLSLMARLVLLQEVTLRS